MVHTKPLTIAHYRVMLGKHIVPALGTLGVAEVERKDILALQYALCEKPTVANRAVDMLVKMLNLAELREMRPPGRNPCKGVRRYKVEPHKERFLTAEEFARLGRALDAAPAEHLASLHAAAAPLDVNAEEQAWDEAMHQALNIARAEGKVPGRVEETVRSAHAGTLDWRTLLRHYMTDTARHDYRWSVPNRRFIDAGLYLPSIRSEGIETIAFIIDVSGSLATATLAEFWAELRGVAAEIRPERVSASGAENALRAI